MMNGRARVTIPVRKEPKITKDHHYSPTVKRNRGKLTRETKMCDKVRVVSSRWVRNTMQ
jgi:hypothetical protein